MQSPHEEQGIAFRTKMNGQMYSGNFLKRARKGDPSWKQRRGWQKHVDTPGGGKIGRMAVEPWRSRQEGYQISGDMWEQDRLIR